MELADQRRREHLQFAQLPFGRAVDELHGPRDLDVDLDARLVHELEAVERGDVLVERRISAPGQILGDLLLQRFDERALVLRRALAQARHHVGVLHPLGTAGGVVCRSEQLDRAGNDSRDKGR